MLAKCPTCIYYAVWSNAKFCKLGESKALKCMKENGSWYDRRSQFLEGVSGPEDMYCFTTKEEG